MSLDPHDGMLVFREVAGQHERDGATEEIIAGGIDFREKAFVPAPGIAAYLRRLAAGGFVEERDSRWFLTERTAAELPRTPRDDLSLFSEAFDRFVARQIAPLFRSRD